MEKNISTFKELREACEKTSKLIWEVIQAQEAEFAEVPPEEIRRLVKRSLDAMKESIQSGLKSKEMSISGMCGDDCDRLQKRFNSQSSLFGKTFEKITTYALAVIEENLRMGKIDKKIRPCLS